MPEKFPLPVLNIPDKTANRWIWGFSAIVFLAVLLLNRVQIPAPDGLDIHVFAQLNAILNSTVSLLLIAGLITAKFRKWAIHRAVMLLAIVLSALFLVSYIAHHLFAGDTQYGGQGSIRWIYYVILVSHIILAAGSLPFILKTAYKSLSGDFAEHRKLARIVWPIWLYVSASGVIVYLMISPYY